MHDDEDRSNDRDDDTRTEVLAADDTGLVRQQELLHEIPAVDEERERP